MPNLTNDNSIASLRAEAARPTLVLVCGLPGSGKTVHARRLEQELPAVRFCPDEWMQALGTPLHDEKSRDRIEQLQWALARRLLSLGQSVLIEWGTWSRRERNRLREEGQALGARVELHYLTAPMEILLENVQRRAMEDRPTTREEMERWAASFQTPNEEEMKRFDSAVVLGDCSAG